MRTVVMIDDEKDFCFFVKANLELDNQFKVIVANNGKQGISEVLHHKPDVVLLDVMMPGMDGFEVLKRLKENEKTQTTPVIMLTARNDDESKVTAAGLYCEDYVLKPIQAEDLKNHIENVLTRSGR